MKYASFALALLLLFTAFDHMMRVDQQRLCHLDDRAPCPRGLWFWE